MFYSCFTLGSPPDPPCVLSPFSRVLTLCDPMDCSPPSSSVHGDSSCKNPGVGCCAVLQGIFPTQGSDSPELSLYSGPIPAPLALTTGLGFLGLTGGGWAGVMAALFVLGSGGHHTQPSSEPLASIPHCSPSLPEDREEPCLLHRPGWKSHLWCQELGETTG